MSKSLSLFSMLLFCCIYSYATSPLKLWYKQPAANWNEALPIGNGHSGAMIFGGIEKERLQLNENTLYSGDPSSVYKGVRITPTTFHEITTLIQTEKYAEATTAVRKKWLGRLHQYYQPFADLFITDLTKGRISKYERNLDITNAVQTTTYTKGKTVYTRKVFASNPENIIVIHCKASTANALDLSLDLASQHPTAVQSKGNNTLKLNGKVPGYIERRTFEQIEADEDEYKHPELYDEKGNRKTEKRILYGEEIGNKGMLFEAQLRPVLPNGGECHITDKEIRITGTDEVYFILSLSTSFNGFQKDPATEGINPTEKNNNQIARALQFPLKQLYARHIADYKNLFDRVNFRLHSDKAQSLLPTNERIIGFAQKNDPELVTLLFQYGRYLMISGSRKGGQPLNLQGIWNDEIIPPWNCGYTTNINLEMNYWLSELTNLSECNEPLFDMIKELQISGEETARDMYNCRGWVFHHNTSIWRETYPNDGNPRAAYWPMGHGWLCSHLWEHYAYTGDIKFLRETAYPIMKGACEFFADWLIKDEKGRWVTPVSTSPENKFRFNGKEAHVSMGSTMDMAIIRETFTHTLRAAKILHTDSIFCQEINNKLPDLLPYQIGSKGQLLEWMHEFEEMEPTHRHLSHLYGFYPGNQITHDQTPNLFKAVRRTLEIRGDEAVGWSMGWKVNCWARMLDGNHAHKIISCIFNPIGFGSNLQKGGGLYANLLDACPPFQIDGNLGVTAGIAEMLLQSHTDYIHLLPALPDIWKSGEISGLKTRGNFTVSMQWDKNQLKKALIISNNGNNCQLRDANAFVIKENKKVIGRSIPVVVNGRTYHQIQFSTSIGGHYELYK